MGEMWGAAVSINEPLVDRSARDLVVDWLDFVTLSAGYMETDSALDELRNALDLGHPQAEEKKP
jgi:hypothetical protein